MQQIEDKENKSDIDSSKDEVLVVPYDGLAPISEGDIQFKLACHWSFMISLYLDCYYCTSLICIYECIYVGMHIYI